MFNQDITIVNKWFNTVTKRPEYRTHSLKGFYSSNNGIGINGVDLVKNDGFVARILMSEDGYVSPSAFQSNPIGWTLQKDDYVVKGIVSNITSLNDLDNLEHFKITNFAIKDYGSTDMQHYEISGE